MYKSFICSSAHLWLGNGISVIENWMWTMFRLFLVGLFNSKYTPDLNRSVTIFRLFATFFSIPQLNARTLLGLNQIVLFGKTMRALLSCSSAQCVCICRQTPYLAIIITLVSAE